MALARIKTWIAEVLTASDLNAEFNNILNFLNTAAIIAVVTRNSYKAFSNSAPTGTTSATTVQMGLGSSWTLTPASTGRVRISITGWATNSAATNTAVNATYGTGTAPINGAAKTGTYFSTADVVVTGAAGAPAVPFSLIYEAVSLTVGTAYWFDIVLTSNGVGTASCRITGVIIEELP